MTGRLLLTGDLDAHFDRPVDTITVRVLHILQLFGLSQAVNVPKAIVKPLLKKASLDLNILKNFRPVLNLPLVSKLLEKLVLS